MSNIICIIDDHLTRTSPVLKGIMLYEQNVENEINDIKYRVCFVINGEYEASYKENLDKLKIRMEGMNNANNEEKVRCCSVCIKDKYDEYLGSPENFLEDVNRTMQIDEGDNVLYLLDLELYDRNDEEKINADEACLSMKVYAWLKENGQHCRLFTSFHAENFMQKWLNVYNDLYIQEEEPEIFSRAFLSYTAFEMRYGKEIMDVFR